MHIALFFQYYHNPDCGATGRHYRLLKHLGQRHRITLITADTWYHQRITHRFDWLPPGVEARMLPVAYHNRMNARARLGAYGQYAIRALLHGLRGDRPDLIWGSSTPLSAAWAADLVARLRGVPWVFEVRDLWPDFLIQMGAVSNPWLQQRLYTLEHRLYERAAHVLALSPDMEAHILTKGIPPERVTMAFNGTDFELLDAVTAPDLIELRTANELGDRRIVLYAGTFGRANDIPTLLAAVRRLAHRDDLWFLFAGHGYHEADIRRLEARQSNIRLLPPQARPEMLAWFKLAHVSLVSFLDLPVLAANSPAKLFDSLGAGTPVIVTNPGWTRTFVRTHQCGWYVPPSTPEALAAQIEHVMEANAEHTMASRNAGRVARTHFDRSAQAVQLETLFEEVVASHFHR